MLYLTNCCASLDLLIEPRNDPIDKKNEEEQRGRRDTEIHQIEREEKVRLSMKERKREREKEVISIKVGPVQANSYIL
tara:strand:+ start:719 stop:952 length:234 start_codon:yes stop_codon:yes gene_type:complete